jgi:hypothetical protein
MAILQKVLKATGLLNNGSRIRTLAVRNKKTKKSKMLKNSIFPIFIVY